MLAAAEALNADLRALAAAGCPLIEVHEPAAIEIGSDEAARRLFREAHRRLLDGVDGPHLSLAIVGGNADADRDRHAAVGSRTPAWRST